MLAFTLPIFLQTNFHHVLVHGCRAGRSKAGRQHAGSSLPVPEHQGSKAQDIFQHGETQGDMVWKERGNWEDSAIKPVLFALLFHCKYCLFDHRSKIIHLCHLLHLRAAASFLCGKAKPEAAKQNKACKDLNSFSQAQSTVMPTSEAIQTA